MGATGEAESIPDTTDLIYLRPPGESLRSDHVLAYSIEDDTGSVVFADSHVRSMSLDEARPMIEEQAGVTLDQLAAQIMLTAYLESGAKGQPDPGSIA